MLDIKFVEENIEKVKENIKRRGYNIDLEPFLHLSKDRKVKIRRLEELRNQRNTISKEVREKIKRGEDVEELKDKVRAIGEEIVALERGLKETEEGLNRFLLYLPNMLHVSVVDGEGEKDNIEIRRWGEAPSFDFDPRPHWEIGERLGILDFMRGAKMAGSRFTLYMNRGALLERALSNFMLDFHTKERGYIEVLPPFMVNSRAMMNTGQLPKFQEDLFRVADTDYYMIPTAEVPLTNIFSNEILDQKSLPLKFVSWTPCFRKEAGSYGKDVRGLIRQHQFHKVELVKFTTPEESYYEHELLLQDAEEILKRLGLHYRVVLLSSRDTGFSAAKCYDIEVWLPSQKEFKEISSCSNFEDFQARRAGIRYRPAGGGRPKFVHTLNGSGLAIGRTVVAILENFQNRDGSVTIPQAIVPYMNGITKLE